VDSSGQFLSPSAAAERLGVSTKALRLYERRELMAPARTGAGWRVYGPDDMARAEVILGLRQLGLGLTQIARFLAADATDLDEVLAGHQAALEDRIRQFGSAIARTRQLRSRLARRRRTDIPDLSRLSLPTAEITVAFDLPWPWGGERFELRDIRALNFIVGPLGSGKTRLAEQLAKALPDAAFVGLKRAADDAVAAQARMSADHSLRSRVAQTMDRLVKEGAAASSALTALVAVLECQETAILVIDMIEQRLDQTTQVALIAHLRRRQPGSRPLFMLTRSSAILDLAIAGPDEAIIFCPANHSPPIRVAPCPGSPGYEAVATCLASPEVRARTEGVIARRPEAV